ncbi:MAG: hypothetical protein U0169_15935 [Polyangiaceae bacterium]
MEREPVNPENAYARALRSYERGRARSSFAFAGPLLAFAVLAVCLGTSPGFACAVGVALVAVAWGLGWRGESWGRAVFPGVIAGAIPLALSFAARSYGHVCAGGSCVSLCVPACTAGGLVAGFVLARAGANVRDRGRYFAGAVVLALLVGSLGCSCVGFGGILGMTFGTLVTLAPSLVRLRPTST